MTADSGNEHVFSYRYSTFTAVNAGEIDFEISQKIFDSAVRKLHNGGYGCFDQNPDHFTRISPREILRVKDSKRLQRSFLVKGGVIKYSRSEYNGTGGDIIDLWHEDSGGLEILAAEFGLPSK